MDHVAAFRDLDAFVTHRVGGPLIVSALSPAGQIDRTRAQKLKFVFTFSHEKRLNKLFRAIGMISGYRARMARAALGISRETLAKDSGASVAALQAFENGKRTPQERTHRDIQRALEAYGVEFIDRGVRVIDSAPTDLSRASVA